MQNWPQLFPKQVVIVRQISKELQYSLPEERKTVLYVGIKSNKNNHKKKGKMYVTLQNGQGNSE